MQGVKVKESLFPKITETFDVLLFVLRERWEKQARKKSTAQFRLLTTTKLALELIQAYIADDKWNGVYCILQAHPITTIHNNLCLLFRDDVGLKWRVIREYKSAMKSTLDWADKHNPLN